MTNNQMTRTEARKLATAMNVWRRDLSGTVDMPSATDFGIALDVLTQPNTIAENIRNAAINWPQFLGDVECDVVEAFAQRHYYKVGLFCAAYHPRCSDSLQMQSRTFMLFAAEALES